MQPCQGITWWAHRDDDRQRGNQFLALLSNPIGSKVPDASKIPARRAEYSLTESASSPVQAEPRQVLADRNSFEPLAMRFWPNWSPLSSDPQSSSFKLIEISVGCRMPQRSAHSDDLALVVEGMGQDMVKDECRSANGDVSIGKLKFFGGVELLIRKF
jgi:hypothetical protein